MRLGYALSSEELAPALMVETAVAAERVGFRTAWVSDHFHPWVPAQGESPFVWTMLGAILSRTEHLRVGTGVTCPTVRVHPAIVAQAAATTSVLAGPGRFFLGLGSGEQLNEHVTGAPWPPAGPRLAMLREALAVIRELWTGKDVTHRGEHFTVEDARLYTCPSEPPPVMISAFGPKALDLAVECGDGWISTHPDDDAMRRWREERGGAPTLAQLKVAYAPTEAEARDVYVERWPTSGLAGQLSQELRTPALFEQAVSVLSPEQIVDGVPLGPDPQPYVDAIRSYADAGFDELYLTPVGPRQLDFVEWCASTLLPALPAGIGV